MRCEACTNMRMMSDPVAHRGLVDLHKPTKLRPLGRPAIVVRQYRCRLCTTNWLVESDSLWSGATEWLCLNESSNILAPLPRGSRTTWQPGTWRSRRREPDVTAEPGSLRWWQRDFLRATAGKA